MRVSGCAYRVVHAAQVVAAHAEVRPGALVVAVGAVEVVERLAVATRRSGWSGRSGLMAESGGTLLLAAGRERDARRALNLAITQYRALGR